MPNGNLREITASLRALPCGARLVVPGKTGAKMGNYIRAARRGTQKHFTARTLTTGAEVVRVE